MPAAFRSGRLVEVATIPRRCEPSLCRYRSCRPIPGCRRPVPCPMNSRKVHRAESDRVRSSPSFSPPSSKCGIDASPASKRRKATGVLPPRFRSDPVPGELAAARNRHRSAARATTCHRLRCATSRRSAFSIHESTTEPGSKRSSIQALSTYESCKAGPQRCQSPGEATLPRRCLNLGGVSARTSVTAHRGRHGQMRPVDAAARPGADSW